MVHFEREILVLDLEDDWTKAAGIRLLIKREDEWHPLISGNKWRKLKYNLKEAKNQGKHTLLTFGGAYSNHLAATAAAGKKFDFATIGIVRGEAVLPLNPTLALAQENGMQLYFSSRAAYRDKTQLLHSLPFATDHCFIVPEGGTNEWALPGCREIVTDYTGATKVNYWCVSCGTGGTLAGMITGLNSKQNAIGFSALKGDFLTQTVQDLLPASSQDKNWSINTDYHFGGYARYDDTLIQFINNFKQNHHIALDPIYTGKLLFGIYDLIKKGFFPRGSTIMAIHTGGLQGIAGFNARFGNLLD